VVTLLRKVLQIPFYARCWNRALRASASGDWQGVVDSLAPFNARGLATNESRLWLGNAYCCLRQWDKSVEQFDQITRRANEPEAEGRRHYNHALALANLGRISEAIALLAAEGNSRWPEQLKDKARSLLEDLKRGNMTDRRALH